MTEVSPLSVLILNVNGLNSIIKKQRLEEWSKKKKKIQLYTLFKRLSLVPKSQTA